MSRTTSQRRPSTGTKKTAWPASRGGTKAASSQPVSGVVAPKKRPATSRKRPAARSNGSVEVLDAAGRFDTVLLVAGGPFTADQSLPGSAAQTV